MNDFEDPSAKAVLICGLGRLGQHCAAQLKELGIPVFGLHDIERESWEIEDVPRLLDRFTVGDCSRHSVLERAGIASCRAALFTTSDERVNVSGALAARALNPSVRLVIRSSQSNLNDRLTQKLGNLMALDIAELPAAAFSLAAMGDEIVGLLSVDGEFLRVVEKRITATDHWAAGRALHDLNTRWRRVLHRSSAGDRQAIDLHGWDPDERVQPGDVLSYIEFNQPAQTAKPVAAGTEPARPPTFTWNSIRSRIGRLWPESTQTQRVVTLTAGALILLHATGVLLYKLQYPEVSLLDAFNVATVLIFDGYSNMFAQLKLPFPISLWMLLFSLMMTISGAVVMGMVYAFLTARLLTARLEFRRRPGRVPRAKHVVVIGMGPLGRRIAELLHSLEQPVVGVSAEELAPGVLPGIPVITGGDPRQGLKRANGATAAGVMAMTDEDVTNLELVLMASQLNENCRLVIRTDDVEFGRNVTSLAPHTHAMSIYALSAEVFSAAALGERILNLLRIRHQTILTTEFQVETGDTFDGRLLVEVTCGYGLVAILYQRSPCEHAEFFPPEDIRLEAGNRLVVLATIGGLQNAEHGVAAERNHRVRVQSASSAEAVFEGTRIISRVTGCSLGTARAVMSHLAATLPQNLFRHQAQRLVRELGVAGVIAEVLPAEAAGPGAASQSID